MPRQYVRTYAKPSIYRLLISGGKRNISKNSVPSYPICHIVTWPTFCSPCALNAGEILGLSTMLWLGRWTSYMNTLSGNQQNSSEYKVRKTKYCSKLPRFTLLLSLERSPCACVIGTNPLKRVYLCHCICALGENSQMRRMPIPVRMTSKEKRGLYIEA